MSEIRIEKKFVYQEGDDSFRYFLLNSMIKKIYSNRKINSIYFDTETLKNIWDNINGYGNRTKIRLRWYDNLNNSTLPPSFSPSPPRCAGIKIFQIF